MWCIYSTCGIFCVDHVSVMLRHVFESHQTSNPVEELIKAAAAGDVAGVEEVVCHRYIIVLFHLSLSLSFSFPLSLSL